MRFADIKYEIAISRVKYNKSTMKEKVKFPVKRKK